MERYLKKMTAVLLLLLQLLLLSSCLSDKTDDPTSSDDGQDTAGQPVSLSLLDESGEPKYKIVRPEKPGSDLLDAAVDLRKKIVEASGKSFKITEDWERTPEDIDNESFEILIGLTNRAASIAAAEGLGVRDYRIRVSGNKIVICGGSEEATVTALGVFIEKYLKLSDSPMIELPGAVEYLHSYAVKEANVAGLPISGYTIVYSKTAEPEEGIEIAELLQSRVTELCGFAPKIEADVVNSTGGEREILVGNPKRDESAEVYEGGFGSFDYSITMKNGKLIVSGGSTIALTYAVKLLADKYIYGGVEISADINDSGSMYGKYVYERADGTELRIMSNNTWNCDNNKPGWLAIGENCSAEVRAVGLAGVYMAYLPDVICFQEMTTKMVSLIRKELNAKGYSYSLLSYTSGGSNDYTCIIYRSDTVSLIKNEQGHHLFAYGNDSKSKGYTWGHFELKATGEDFIALSTHMWWKSETAESGSNEWRRKQAAEIVTKTDELARQYSCPVFVLGDFNTRTTSTAFAEFVKGGFKPAFELAELYASNLGGHHKCDSDGFARETGATTYAANAIDHIILNNAGNTRILTYMHVRPYFYIKLSDHYPIFIDAIL